MKKLLKYTIFVVFAICAVLTVDVMAAELGSHSDKSTTVAVTTTATTAAGSATFVSDEMKEAAQPELTIVNKEKEVLSKVSLKKKQSLVLGSQIQKVSGDTREYKVIWTSSNEKVAVVSEGGKVTAKANGTSTITATLEGTDVSANVKVTVKKNAALKYGAEYDKEVTVASLKKKAGETAKDNMGNIYKKGECLGNFVLTGYCTKCNSGYGRGTSSGKTATAGITVAVNKKQIPIGTKIIIGDHVYVAQDIHGNRNYSKVIDVFFGTRHGAEPLLKNIPVYLAVE